VRRRRLAFAALAVLVVFTASIALGSSLISPPSSATRDGDRAEPESAPSPVTAPQAVPEGLVTFADPRAGFSIAYPRTWERIVPADEEVRLLVADGTRISLLIRVTPVGLTVTRQTLGIARGLTDSLVGADRGVNLLSPPQAITLDGLPGYRYLYTFGAGRDGARGAHMHYFLFRRKRLITLVFQVPGARALKLQSGVLDNIAGTFRATQ